MHVFHPMLQLRRSSHQMIPTQGGILVMFCDLRKT